MFKSERDRLASEVVAVSFAKNTLFSWWESGKREADSIVDACSAGLSSVTCAGSVTGAQHPPLFYTRLEH